MLSRLPNIPFVPELDFHRVSQKQIRLGQTGISMGVGNLIPPLIQRSRKATTAHADSLAFHIKKVCRSSM